MQSLRRDGVIVRRQHGKPFHIVFVAQRRSIANRKSAVVRVPGNARLEVLS